MNWTAWAQAELDAIRRADRWRALMAFDCRGVEGTLRGRDVIVFSSNDYLGLSQHPAVRRAAAEAAQQFGAGATASRLVVGTRSLHEELEGALAAWQRTEAALVFPNGFAANLSVLSVLGGPEVTVFSDELNHASIIDGCRLAKAERRIYRHGDVDHLESLLAATPGRKLVVTDSVFSMDGDVAPLDAIASLCARFDALLVVDEAHAVFGPALHDLPCELLRVGTLSKMLGSLGGWVAGPRSLIELLVNRARPFIFTTGLSPADAAAALAALRICMSEQGERLRAQLRHAVDTIAPAHPSPIVPVILGEDRAALNAAETLLQQGLYVPAIRPPTVPAGTARLRIALSALHTEPMLQKLRQALHSLQRVAA
ncbi:MAG TPA: 8-amino-7-oxononanoate synthase [Povalibacter sp.]|uniref:aminotransferase class I/II-fold pyridoxal phosphate-dependent enzyme n=1 Tax=Povalibacter sp. TaxID=1962978 RepID=UPI002CF3C61B|nr:8-amino-7-oxononanoate synthase [Povalibacter sp.]HMN44194.1 8-amino-7-oxononanoate synthase [Povalibacter sp.]